MIFFDLFLSQVDSSPEHQLACIQNSTQAIAWVIITLCGTGGAVGVSIRGFFDARNAEKIAELKGEIIRFDLECKHLSKDLEEEKTKNNELTEENNQLKSSGFSTQLIVIENELNNLKEEKKDLLKKLKKAVVTINELKGK